MYPLPHKSFMQAPTTSDLVKLANQLLEKEKGYTLNIYQESLLEQALAGKKL
jgi:hypothetical protein